MNLFDMMQKDKAPLAERMRPTSLDDFVGQSHIVGKNSLLRRGEIGEGEIWNKDVSSS